MRFAEATAEMLVRATVNPDGFEHLCRCIEHDLYALCWGILRDHDRAAEAMQDCLLRLYRFLPQLRDTDKFTWWFTRMVVNQCRTNMKRARQKEDVSLDEEIEVDNRDVVAAGVAPVSPRDTLERKELAQSINEAIAKLPERQRSAIILYEVECHSVAEVAELMDCSEGAVKFNLHEGRKKLQQMLMEVRQAAKTSRKSGGAN